MNDTKVSQARPARKTFHQAGFQTDSSICETAIHRLLLAQHPILHHKFPLRQYQHLEGVHCTSHRLHCRAQHTSLILLQPAWLLQPQLLHKLLKTWTANRAGFLSMNKSLHGHPMRITPFWCDLQSQHRSQILFQHKSQHRSQHKAQNKAQHKAQQANHKAQHKVLHNKMFQHNNQHNNQPKSRSKTQSKTR